MNGDSLDRELDGLFARARAQRTDTSAVEYAFETRLLARLRERRETSSIWATVAWRAVPFFAACVVGLFFWQSELASEASDALGVASLNDPASTELWSN